MALSLRSSFLQSRSVPVVRSMNSNRAAATLGRPKTRQCSQAYRQPARCWSSLMASLASRMPSG